jgi:hypothetical protein
MDNKKLMEAAGALENEAARITKALDSLRYEKIDIDFRFRGSSELASVSFVARPKKENQSGR